MHCQSHSKNILAFTLAELSVVIVILGGMAAIAIPNYLTQRKVICNQEGVGILKALFDAQTDYHRDKEVFTGTKTDLAFSIDGSGKCFNNYSVSVGTGVTCGQSYTSIASIVAKDNSYTLDISDQGQIVCTPCGSHICTVLGY